MSYLIEQTAATRCAANCQQVAFILRNKTREDRETVAEDQLRKAADMIDELEALRAAVAGIADDYQTSENHHPAHVLIPVAKFDQIVAALASLTEGAKS